VVVVHGFGEHTGRLEAVSTGLIDAGLQVWNFDLRGHGRSSGRRGHIDDWRNYHSDLGQVVQMAYADRPDLPLFLFGHSLGGLIVVEYLLSEPSKLTGAVVSGPLLVQPRLPWLKFYLGRLLSRAWPTFSIRVRIDPATLSRDREEQGDYEKDPLVHNRGTARLSTEIARIVEWVQEHAGQLSRPLLVAHGGDDRLVPIDGSRKFAERAGSGWVTLLEYPGARHELHHDLDAARYLDDVRRWLREQSRRTEA